jgi:hypothetical protein
MARDAQRRGKSVEKAGADPGIENNVGYPAGPKPATGVPPVPEGLRQPRKMPSARNSRHSPDCSGNT